MLHLIKHLETSGIQSAASQAMASGNSLEDSRTVLQYNEMDREVMVYVCLSGGSWVHQCPLLNCV